MSSLISELSAKQLAEHALNVFITQGRHIEGARLIYRALRLDPENAAAMRCLSDFFDENGTEPFSAIVMEYALSPDSHIEAGERKAIEALRFRSKWWWGFSRHASGETQLGWDDFEKREDFVVDEERYQAFIDGLVDEGGSLRQGYEAAITLCGCIAGFLHNPAKPKLDIKDCFDRSNFVDTPDYQDWLSRHSESFDQLKLSVEKMRQTQ